MNTILFPINNNNNSKVFKTHNNIEKGFTETRRAFDNKLKCNYINTFYSGKTNGNFITRHKHRISETESKKNFSSSSK